MTDPAVARLNAKDVVLGALLVAIAAGGLYVNQDYVMGTASRMGPGYMPRLVLGLLAFFGLALILAGLRSGPERLGRWAWRELVLVLAAMTAFAVLLKTLGLGLCLAILVVVSGVADRSQTFKGLAGLTAALIALCWLVFIRGLGIVVPFFPPALGWN